jgi:pimeloyl-ACP methyl ester carboxylesterase
VLCGHSYGGMVISGVVEQTESAIASLVFLDAFVPNDGEALADITAPRVKEIIRVAKEKGEQSIPPPPAALFEVNEKDRAWVDGLCGPQPLKTFTEKIALTGARERIAKKTYIRAGTYENPGFDRALDQVKADSSWRTYSVPCGHDVMVDMPEKLAESLVEAA